jgi:hypothetical protein
VRSPGTVLARFRQKLASGDALDSIRRHTAMRVDQAWVLGRHHVARVASRRRPEPFDGTVRIGLITVNFRTTRFLKLLLLTLGEQSAVDLVRRLVIVDNGSDADDVAFLRRLTTVLPRVELVERRHFLDHASGLRAGVRWLTIVDREVDSEERCNVLLLCDTDVAFRSPDALRDLAATVVREDAALVGEWRGQPDDPDVQASFLAVRRDAYDRRDVVPPVHHGSPTRWMQRSIAATRDLRVADFASNHGGHVLHRGRTSAGAPPHFMGLPDGPRGWAQIESRFAALLAPDAEQALLDHLAASGRCEPAATTADSRCPTRAAPFDPAVAVVWAPGVLQRRTLGAILVLRPPGELVRLSGFGPALWPMLERPTAPADIIDTVVESFSVDTETARDEISRFVQELLEAGALRRAD